MTAPGPSLLFRRAMLIIPVSALKIRWMLLRVSVDQPLSSENA